MKILIISTCFVIHLPVSIPKILFIALLLLLLLLLSSLLLLSVEPPPFPPSPEKSFNFRSINQLIETNFIHCQDLQLFCADFLFASFEIDCFFYEIF